MTTAAAKGAIIKVLKENYGGAAPKPFYVPSAKIGLVTDLVYTDANLGQALRVDRNSHALILLESQGFKTGYSADQIYDPAPESQPVDGVEPVNPEPARITPPTAQTADQQAEGITDLITIDDSVEPAWVGPLKSQVEEGFAAFLETLRSVNTALNNLTAQINLPGPEVETDTSALDDLESHTVNTVPEEDMTAAVEDVLAKCGLADVSVRKLRETIRSRGLVGRARTMAERGVPRPDVLETLRANVQAEISGEMSYINSIAPAQVVGAGGDTRQESTKPATSPDVNGVLAKYGMIAPRNNGQQN